MPAIRRLFEAYTLTRGAIIDNGNNFVSILDITGRGRLQSFGWYCDGDEEVTVRIEIDSGGFVSTSYPASGTGAGTDASASQSTSAGFETAMEIQMRIAAAGQASFWAVALVE